MTDRKGTLKYELLLLLMSAIWGGGFVSQQVGMMKGLGPMTFNALRFALGCLSLAPVMLWRAAERKREGRAPAQLPVKWSLLAGVFLFAAAAFQQVGLQYTSSANSGFITAFYVLFVPLLGLCLRIRVSGSLWVGVLICLTGFYLLSVTEGFRVGRGDALTLASAVFWACQILAIDHAAARGDPVRIAALQFAVCAILSAMAAGAFETSSPALIQGAAGAIAYAGFASVGIAFTLQVICQKRCPPAPAAVIMSMEAVFAALAGYLVLDQRLTVRGLAGCGLILCGVLVVQLAPMWRSEKR